MTKHEAADQLESSLELPEVERLITRLRRRAKGLRAYAISILCMIVIILAMGSWVFVSADTRALNDALRGKTTNGAKFDELSDRLDDLNTERDSLTTQRAEAQKRYNEAWRSSNDVVVQNERVTKPMDEMTTIDLQVGKIDEKSATLRREQRNLEDTTLPKDARVALTISALTTRVGAVVLLLFLVQILTPLFRYNMILAAHYDACADGLALTPRVSLSTDAQVLEQVVRTMSPHVVTFGEAPQSPVERTVHVAAGVLSKK